MKTILKRAAVAAIVFATAAGATVASAGAQTKGKGGETILMPYAVGCWTDEGYGRRSSCDTN